MFIYLESSLMTSEVRVKFAEEVRAPQLTSLMAGEATAPTFRRLTLDTVTKEKEDKVYNNAIIGLEVTRIQGEEIYIKYDIEIGRVMTQLFNDDVKAWKTTEGYRHAHGSAKLALVGTVYESIALLTEQIVAYWNATADAPRDKNGTRDYKKEKAAKPDQSVITAGLRFSDNVPSCCLVAIDDKLTTSKEGNLYYRVIAFQQYGMVLKTNSSVEVMQDTGACNGEKKRNIDYLNKVKQNPAANSGFDGTIC
jgi:hypothetical protein